MEMLMDFNDIKVFKHFSQLLKLHSVSSNFCPTQSIPLVISTRFLICQGPLKQLSIVGPKRSFDKIYLHLFNDLLIISTKKYFISGYLSLMSTAFQCNLVFDHDTVLFSGIRGSLWWITLCSLNT